MLLPKQPVGESNYNYGDKNSGTFILLLPFVQEDAIRSWLSTSATLEIHIYLLQQRSYIAALREISDPTFSSPCKFNVDIGICGVETKQEKEIFKFGTARYLFTSDQLMKCVQYIEEMGPLVGGVGHTDQYGPHKVGGSHCGGGCHSQCGEFCLL